MNVVVSGRREDALVAVAGELSALGIKAHAVPVDLSDLNHIDPMIERSEAALGPIGLLLNNAGIEITSAFTSYTRAELTSIVDVNLTAPLLLTHRLVGRMLSRGRGHVVFISSAAGKLGPAYQEPYAATKVALIGLTQSPRAEYPNAPVGFSVVCPGFIAGDGMYQRMLETGIKSNRLLGETTTKKVTDRVIEAIWHDQPESSRRALHSGRYSHSANSPPGSWSVSRPASGSRSCSAVSRSRETGAPEPDRRQLSGPHVLL